MLGLNFSDGALAGLVGIAQCDQMIGAAGERLSRKVGRLCWPFFSATECH